MEDPSSATAKIIMLLLLEQGVITREQYDRIEARMSSFMGQSYSSVLRRLRDEQLKDS